MRPQSAENDEGHGLTCLSHTGSRHWRYCAATELLDSFGLGQTHSQGRAQELACGSWPLMARSHHTTSSFLTQDHYLCCSTCRMNPGEVQPLECTAGIGRAHKLLESAETVSLSVLHPTYADHNMGRPSSPRQAQCYSAGQSATARRGILMPAERLRKARTPV
jgi:hypothetical protein